MKVKKSIIYIKNTRYTFKLVLCCTLLTLSLMLTACEEQASIQAIEHAMGLEAAICEDEEQLSILENYSTVSEYVALPTSRPHQTIAAGAFHSLVIIDGSLWAWGANSDGQLGDGTTEQRSRPIQVGTDTDWASVHIGMNHTVALKTDGSLWAWGRNEHGELGDGTTQNRASPVQIGIDTNWASVSVGENHNMAIKADGSLWAWGRNSHGQIGDGEVSRLGQYVNVLEPIQIGADTDWVRVMPSGLRTMALKEDGSLWFWGSDLGVSFGNGSPYFYSPSSPSQLHNAPIQIGTYEDWIRMLEPGRWHTEFLIKDDGSLWGWGYNSFGQLGDGTTIDRDTPVQIGICTDWVDITLGDTRAVAIKDDGSVWSWGWGGFYNVPHIGDGTYGENRYTPVKIIDGTRLS